MKQKTIYGEYGLEGPSREVKKESKEERRRILTAVVIGVVIAIVGILAAALPAIGHVNSGNLSAKASTAPVVPTQLSAKISGSSVITISDYYTRGYDSGLQCLVDSLPIYCDGSPMIIQGFPPGIHTLSIMADGHTSSLEFQVS